MIDEEAMKTIDHIASVCWNWLEFNDATALELDDEGYGDADEFGMHTLSSGIVRLWNLNRAVVVVQPNFDQQQWLGIIAGQAALWQKENKGVTHETNEKFGLHSLTMAYLRLYHECVLRRIIVPPTHSNPTSLN